MKPTLALCAALLLAVSFCKAEEPGRGNNKDDAQSGRENANRGNNFGGGFGGGGGGFGGGGGRGGPNQGGTAMTGANVTSLASRMLGIDLDSFKKTSNLELLPLAESRRMITRVPVGGVDSFSSTGNGWKMEGVFKLTPDQAKTVETLRDEYAAEQKKLAREIYEEELKLAKKVSDLRVKYEQKATDLLTGADKTAKQQMDALALEVQTKVNATVADVVQLYDINDANQGMAFLQALREKVATFYQSGEDRLMALVPEEARARLQETKKQEDTRAVFGGGRRGFQPGERIGRGGDNGPAVTPPKAPPDQQF